MLYTFTASRCGQLCTDTDTNWPPMLIIADQPAHGLSRHVNMLPVQVNLDMTDSMGPGKLVRHMQNPSYTYDE